MENKKIALFLDDERNTSFIKDKINLDVWEWKVIRNYFDFVDYVDDNFEKIDLISFDHDIDSYDEAGAEWTGRDAARFLIDKCQDQNLTFPNFLVHSMNNIGRTNIIADIKYHISKFEKRKDLEDWRYFHVGFVNGRLIQ